MNGRVIFAANDGTHGREMWVSDGTRLGTRLLKDIVPGRDGVEPAPEDYSDGGGAILGPFLYFTTWGGGTFEEIWRTDGTRAGTTPLGVNGGCLTSAGRLVFFASVNTSEVWRTDGSPPGHS